MVPPGEGEPAVGGQDLVPLVHVNDLGESQAEHHHQGAVVEMGRSGNGTESYWPLITVKLDYDQGSIVISSN